ncbi:hypothetical protein NUW54_g13365 [Trametes sanguinea]|uniref:Uncharacterized protein n=1 Tax=Trametes sanguinea TaxID=158606 RepID=A0ACC1MLV5_9APHY|nr:hypothetical protein NUW54_g13365 [Trametes sanguinea]
MPSASQSMADGYTSEIEEDPAPYRVTIIRQEDLRVEEEAEADVGGGDVDVPMRCRAELLKLRDQIIEEDKPMEDVLSTDIIELLACTLPNDLQSLRASLEEEGIELQLVKRYCPRILSICSKFHMLLR